MENKDRSKQGNERFQMAHWVDVPGPFKDSFVTRVRGISGASRRERVSSLALIFFDLNTYTASHSISIDEITHERKEKARDYGVFNEGYLGIKDGSKKLVRDRWPSLPPRDGDIFTYEKAERDEFLRVLDAKLAEESLELMNADTREKRVEELADVYEVLDAILKYRNIDVREISTRLQSMEVIQRRKLK